MRPPLALVTPALAAANNGNWQTARRWARLLAPHYAVRLCAQWDGGDEALMVALHARRSAPSIRAWRARAPGRPLVVVLTGTDLYRDIAHDADAQAALALADRLLVLNALGAQALPAPWRAKTAVVLPSATPRRTLAKPARWLRALAVGHLRDEKSPQTWFDAARRLAHRADLRLDHVGGALDPALADAARATAAACPHYRWLGALPHGAARDRIQRAHLLVNPSRLEGGPTVVVEALASGTPVLASRCDGHLGLLGADYPGLFDVGDAAGLAALLAQARDDPAMLPALQAHCAARARLHHPDEERRSLLAALRPLHTAPGALP